MLGIHVMCEMIHVRCIIVTMAALVRSDTLVHQLHVWVQIVLWYRRVVTLGAKVILDPVVYIFYMHVNYRFLLSEIVTLMYIHNMSVHWWHSNAPLMLVFVMSTASSDWWDDIFRYSVQLSNSQTAEHTFHNAFCLLVWRRKLRNISWNSISEQG